MASSARSPAGATSLNGAPRRPRSMYDTPPPRPQHHFRSEELLDTVVDARVLAAGLVHQVSDSWASDATLEPPHDVIASSRRSGRRNLAMVAPDGSVLDVSVCGTHVTCDAYARSIERAAELVAELRTLLPEAEPRQGDNVAVHFWSLNERAVPRSIRRMIDVPTWAAIEGNYHATTASQLARLLRTRPDAAAGKLILWHGLPGTGKTWALRALAREWSEWAAAHYITDPEQFFGSSPTYMQAIILGDEERGIYDDGDTDDPRAGWRLLIMEDTGELLAKDAKQRLGQGLSRLLNVCDGLIGQGLRVMVLITTNEDLGTMHPAVTRAGRCLANIRFDPLGEEEVAGWARRRGVSVPSRTGLLADLFSGGDHVVRSDGIGFRVPVGTAG